MNLKPSLPALCQPEFFRIQADNLASEPQAAYGAVTDTSWLISESARKLAKAGAVDEALKIVSDLPDSDRDTAEGTAWVLFYYLRDKFLIKTNVAYKKLLNRYLNLSNRRPSLVHSVVMGIALKICDAEVIFDSLSFFKVWGPENLTDSDYRPYYSDGGYLISPLAERIIYRLVREPFYRGWRDLRQYFAAEYISDSRLKSLFYEAFEAHMRRLIKRQRYERMWEFQRLYLENLRAEAPVGFDSRMLEVALRGCGSNYLNYIVWYLREWGLEAAPATDFEGYVDEEGDEHPSLINQAIDKLYRAIRRNPPLFENEMDWAIDTLGSLAERQSMRYWTDFRRASLLELAGRRTESFELGRSLFQQLNSRPAYWDLMAKLLTDRPELVEGCLSMAIQLSPETDSAAGRHYALGKLLLAENLDEEAREEFAQYLRLMRQHGHRLPSDFHAVARHFGYIDPALTHDDYHRYTPAIKRITDYFNR